MRDLFLSNTPGQSSTLESDNGWAEENDDRGALCRRLANADEDQAACIDHACLVGELACQNGHAGDLGVNGCESVVSAAVQDPSGVPLFNTDGTLALVLGARFGRSSRRRLETGEVLAALKQRGVTVVDAPSDVELEGGDFVHVGRLLLVRKPELGSRTNDEAVCFVRRHAEPLGYRVIEVAAQTDTHLTTVLTYAGRNKDGRHTLVLHKPSIDATNLQGLGLDFVFSEDVAPANVLPVNGKVFVVDGNEGTEGRLKALGFNTRRVRWDGMVKLNIGFTCATLRIETANPV